MSFTEAISAVFGKYAEFSGRAARPEYWWWTLFYFLVAIVLQLAILAIAGDGGTAGLALGLYGLVMLALIIPSLAVFVRRMHDTGRSGWWWFLGLIPLVGPIVLIVFLVQEGNPGPNEYGDPPA